MQGGAAEQSCPVCHSVITPYSALQSHVSSHFEQQKAQDEQGTASALVFAQNEEQQQNDAALAREIAFSEGYRSTELDPVQNDAQIANTLRGGLAGTAEEVLHDVCDRIHRYFTAVRAKDIDKVHLCWPTVDLYSSNEWGLGFDCGFRNIQMLLSCCLKNKGEITKRLEAAGIREVPTVPEIQRLIEQAWEKGFDKDGAEQLGGKLQGTQTWIGAVEVAALFRSWRLRANVVDFEVPNEASRKDMLQWAYDYFHQRCKGGKPKGAGGCYVCRKTPFKKRKGHFTPPLYLQHHGHSRSIIGAEKTSAGDIRLLVIDPTRGFAKHLAQTPAMSHIRYHANSKQLVEQPRFQITYLSMNPLVNFSYELEDLKIINSDKR